MPLKLFPEYELMQQARGVKAVAPTDLVLPRPVAARAEDRALKSVTPQKLPSYLVKQRRLYQRGLLAWLRGDEESAKVMRDAIQGIEDVQTHSSQRSFWWTVGALLESIVEKGVESGFGVKQLCGRVDLQIRRFVEGSAKVSDRMRREVLYYVAISAPVGTQVQAVQRALRTSWPDSRPPKCFRPTSCARSRCCASRAISWLRPRTCGSRLPAAVRKTCPS